MPKLPSQSITDSWSILQQNMSQWQRLQNSFHDTLAWSNSQGHRGVWVICSTTSLLTARHLLVESNFHHPELVYIAQLCMTTVVLLFRVRWRHRDPINIYDRREADGAHTADLNVVGSMVLTAVSMLLLLQAILHFNNLPTLAMLMTVAVFVSHAATWLFEPSCHTTSELLRCSVLLIACVGILATEYRLSVNALITSIPAMVCAGLANALRRRASRHQRRDGSPSQTPELLNLVIAGFLIVAGWILFAWPNQKVFAVDAKLALLLVINAATTTGALCVGQSNLLPTFQSSSVAELDSDEAESQSQMVWVVLAVVGITGCHSMLSTRRSYTNWYQFCCFAVAMFCIAYVGSRSNSHATPVQFELLVIAEADEESVSSEGVVERRSIGSQLRHTISRVRAEALFTSMLFVWFSYMFLNSSKLEHTAHYTLDGGYKPAVPLEIVISMYREPAEDIRDLITTLNARPETSGASVTIYNKDQDADTETIRSKTGADKVISLPNVGREGETYLYHIVHEWDQLAKHTIFLQADIHNSREFYTRLWSYFDSNHTGFLSLGFSGVCSCEDCGDRFFWRDTTGLMPQYHKKVSNQEECNNLLLSYKGQFVVSAARVRGIEKTVYEELRHALVDEDSWAHRPEYLQGRPDSMSAPDFGFTIERMWNLLFQCSSMDIAWRCPTLLSGWRIGGNIEDCQCFDSRPVDQG